MKRLIAQAKQLFREGFFHIFGSSVLAQVGGLISSMIVVRGLPKTEYGYYVSANNIYSYFQILIGLGLTNAILQYCSEHVSQKRKDSVFRYSLTHGMFANILICLGIFLFSFWKISNGQTQIASYLQMMAFLPFVVYLFNYLQTTLRVQLMNREYSYANMAYSLTILIGNILLTALFRIPGLILSMYLAYLVGAWYSLRPLQQESFLQTIFQRQNRLSRPDSREITRYALTCALTNLASTILVLLDVTCLDLVLADSSVLADYKVASTIPAAMTFIPSSMITFFYPKLVEAFSQGKPQGFALLRQLLRIYAVINGFFYLCLALGAPIIIWLIFGEKYLNVIPIFQILSLNYLIYSIRSLLGNVIAAIKKVRLNLYLAILSGIINIVLNLILINLLGSMGAALSTLSITVLMGILCAAYLYHYRTTENLSEA